MGISQGVRAGYEHCCRDRENMTLLGINWCNSNVQASEAFRIFKAGGFECCVVLSTAGCALPRVIRRTYPTATIIARLFRGGPDLPSVADAVSDWRDYVRDTQDVVDLYQVDNEPDQNYPHVLPEDFCMWWVAVTQKLQEASSKRLIVGFPMPSIQGAGSVDYMKRCSVGIDAADWLAERAYWQESWQMQDVNWGRRFQIARIIAPGKPIHLGEYGCSAELEPIESARQYREFVGGLPSYIGSANAFIMAGGTDDWRLFWIDRDMAELMRAKEEPMPELVLGFKVLAERLVADGHTVLAVADEISIDHASLQRVLIDGEPNLFAWQDGQESVVVYSLV